MNVKTFVFYLIFIVVTVQPGQAGDHPYTIEDAYRAALGKNEMVRIAEENVVQSETQVDQAWTYVYPRLNVQSGYTRFNETLPKDDGSFLFQPLEQFQAALVMTQPLYTGGRTLAALRTAKKMEESSRSGLTAAKEDILMKVAESYYGVLRAVKSIEIGKHSLARMEHHQEVTRREAETRNTKANKSALLRADTLVSQARINLVRAEDGLRVAQENLGLLTKLPPDAVLSEPVPEEEPSDDLAKLKETALKNRVDYAGSKMNQDIARENVTIVRGAHYPQLFALAGVQYQNSHPEIVTDATTYYGGVRLQIPLFEGGLMKAEVDEARSRVRQAELSTALLRQTIESEVNEAYFNLKTVSSVLSTAKLQLGYAKTNFDTVEGLFAEGLVSSLSLIDAEQVLDAAEQELMNDTYDHQLAILRLKKSIGMLWQDYSYAAGSSDRDSMTR